jgi:pimeloyl-ACP methyl ester carboxylesterase
MFDFLGYGDSDKPYHHHYSTFEHADTVASLWEQLGISETGIIGHDLGNTVTQELLARQSEKQLKTHIRGAALMNSAVYTENYQPVLITRLMQRPITGPIIVRLLSEKTFLKNLSSLFATQHPPEPDDLHQYWYVMQHKNGLSNIPHLLHYIPEKKQHQPRWAGALEKADIPIRFLWGLADPTTGKVIAENIRRHQPKADLVTYPDVGHFPHLEVPDRIATEISRMF